MINKGWTDSIQLTAGDQLLQKSGDIAEVISIVNLRFTQTTYNLEVANNHNYFVGESQILVHNDSRNCSCNIGVQDLNSSMLGANGTKTASKTLWKGKDKERIDVENPNPGQRAGQVHYQNNKNNKYLYSPKTNSFPGAPKAVNKMLTDKKFKAAIDKAMTKYLGE